MDLGLYVAWELINDDQILAFLWAEKLKTLQKMLLLLMFSTSQDDREETLEWGGMCV